MGQWWSRYWSHAIVVAIGVVLLVLTLVVTSDGATDTENTLWTFILFAVGVGSSYWFGKRSVTDAAKEQVRSFASPAARRLVTLGTGLRAIDTDLALHEAGARKAARETGQGVPIEQVKTANESVRNHLELQTKMVVDALEDWRQFDPDIANELLEEGNQHD
jgi:hypothetical protein